MEEITSSIIGTFLANVTALSFERYEPKPSAARYSRFILKSISRIYPRLNREMVTNSTAGGYHFVRGAIIDKWARPYDD